MATTKTEKVVELLNYGLISRQNTSKENRRKSNSYPEALKNIISIYDNQAKKGMYTPSEIEDFKEQVSLVNVLDDYDQHLGLAGVPLYCEELLGNFEYEEQEEMVRRVA